jgi:hypothetical protein
LGELKYNVTELRKTITSLECEESSLITTIRIIQRPKPFPQSCGYPFPQYVGPCVRVTDENNVMQQGNAATTTKTIEK